MIKNSIGKTLSEVQYKIGLSLAGPLAVYVPFSLFNSALKACGQRSRVSAFSPWIVFWAFLGQVLDTDSCCRKALARINACRQTNGLATLVNDTSGYCKARKRLPEQLFRQLF
ncbi:MAG: hypothetical protein ACYTGH_17660, partial [Planctomycetota bacterium]